MTEKTINFQESVLKEKNISSRFHIAMFVDCGGFVENLGGAITMMNMVERGGSIKSYDCIWLIRPPNNFYHLKTHIYLKVATFLDMGEREA